MSEFNDNEVDRVCDKLYTEIADLRAQLADLRGPILTAMLEDDRADAWLMRRLVNAHGRPGICWKHGAVNHSVEWQIAPDWNDYWSCGASSCSYQFLEGELA